MVEEIIGVIPRIMRKGPIIKYYSLAITSERLIFLLDVKDFGLLAYAVGGFPGVFIEYVRTKNQYDQYINNSEKIQNIDIMIKNAKSHIVMPINRVHKCELKRSRLDEYKISITGMVKDNKLKFKFKGAIMHPVDKAKTAGWNLKKHDELRAVYASLGEDLLNISLGGNIIRSFSIRSKESLYSKYNVTPIKHSKEEEIMARKRRFEEQSIGKKVKNVDNITSIKNDIKDISNTIAEKKKAGKRTKKLEEDLEFLKSRVIELESGK